MARKTAEPTQVGEIIADAFEAELLPGERSSFEEIRMGATLQDIKVGAATNGANYSLTFEVTLDGHIAASRAMSEMGKQGFFATFDKFLIGEGATIRAVSGRGDADGAAHFKVGLHLSQSEIARSHGRMGSLVGKHGLLTLEPQQGTLRLEDGREVDLTARAED